MIPRRKLIATLVGILIVASVTAGGIVYAASAREGVLVGVPAAEQFTIEHTDCSGTIRMLRGQEGGCDPPLDCQRVVPTDPEAAQSHPDHYAPLQGSPEVAAQLCEGHLEALRGSEAVAQDAVDALQTHCADLRRIADAAAEEGAPE